MSDKYHKILGAAIDRAAELLPEGYEIVISIENGGYGVKLSQPNDLSISVDGGGLAAEIIELTAIAVGKGERSVQQAGMYEMW